MAAFDKGNTDVKFSASSSEKLENNSSQGANGPD